MDMDHYKVLGLPSDEEGAELTVTEITKAYKAKALELHPDKRPADPHAHENFQNLKSSYEILKDEEARKSFDDSLRLKRDQEQCRRLLERKRDAKRQKMVVEARERAAADAQDREEEEEKIAIKFRGEVARIRAMHANIRAAAATASVPKRETGGGKESSAGGASHTLGLDKEKVLKVYWEKVGEEGYTSGRLRGLFSKFGEVEGIVNKDYSRKTRGKAYVLMATKDAAFAATQAVSGDLSNPLLVLPLQRDSVLTYMDGIELEDPIMSLKDVVEAFAQQHGLLFRAKPGKMRDDGHQIYGFGNVSVVVDLVKEKLYARSHPGENWFLVSLEMLLEMHKNNVTPCFGQRSWKS